MTELTNENIELRKTTANAIQKIMTNSGNIAFLNNAIEKFLTELKEQNKECEPAALMMTGALMGFTLHELTTNDENAALKKQVEILDDEAVTVQITQEQYEEYLQLLKKNDELEQEVFNKKLEFEGIDSELTKKENALDEIKEFCIVYSNDHDAYETVYKHILDIINKAKDSKQ